MKSDMSSHHEQCIHMYLLGIHLNMNFAYCTSYVDAIFVHTEKNYIFKALFTEKTSNVNPWLLF